jgi:hypothetical protein
MQAIIGWINNLACYGKEERQGENRKEDTYYDQFS